MEIQSASMLEQLIALHNSAARVDFPVSAHPQIATNRGVFSLVMVEAIRSAKA